MATKPFDAGTYLRGLGWQGPGSSLNNSKDGRAKPVTVVQKKTLAGIGRDRDTSFAWWDAIFSSVANKVGTAQPEQQRTTTGILSHRPPPSKLNAYDEDRSKSGSETPKTGLNLDAMAAVKLEQARRQLYSGFLRGTVINATTKEEEKGTAATGAASSSKGKKRQRSEDEDDDDDSAGTSKEQRRAARAARKEDKARRRAEKEARKATAASASAESTPVTSATTSRSGSPDSALSTSGTSRAEARLRDKALRKAAKLRQKDGAVAVPSATSSHEASPAAAAHPKSTDVDREARDELERARKAIRRAEKEERRLARAIAKKVTSDGTTAA
ncbi:hypothetical protein JCM8202_000959 [Rhodotorula sphaerocarpa]